MPCLFLPRFSHDTFNEEFSPWRVSAVIRRTPNKDCIEEGTNRLIAFSNLSPGDYKANETPGDQKLKELDHLKSRFLANISYPFRTLLTLIQGLMEDLLNGDYLLKIKVIISEMYQNSKRLLRLIKR